MDATDDLPDTKLYRASADLLPAISSQIDHLLATIAADDYSYGGQRWAPKSDTTKLVNLLENFQQWPQLLDTILPEIVTSLASSLLIDVLADRPESGSQCPSQAPRYGLIPLSSATCCILNTLCTVRGWKVIVRFLSNEPQHLEPILQNIILKQSHISWQELYVLFLWLFHLLLTPFDLQSLSISNPHSLKATPDPDILISNKIPLLAKAVITTGLKYLTDAGKHSEPVSRLLARLAQRPDMQRIGLLDAMIKLLMRETRSCVQEPTTSIYRFLGYMSVLKGILKTGSAIEMLPFLQHIFSFCHGIATGSQTQYESIRRSASVRRTLVVILRTVALHILSQTIEGNHMAVEEPLLEVLEETIQFLLTTLGDRETPVRMAASKALSMIAQQLDPDMREEVVQVVLDTLENDMKPQEAIHNDRSPHLTSRQVQAHVSHLLATAEPLAWHGLILTLAQMLFRRIASTDALPSIIRALIQGLSFEQKSTTGVSSGTVVRDAACFGCWSLARKYSTPELEHIKLSSFISKADETAGPSSFSSVLQVLATNLVVSACLDPSGNLRRGSSAALQELVGRHPDTIIKGIELVQRVDYHAVARRSKAILEVAGSAAALSDVYKWALVDALFGWRGIQASDEDSRRVAAMAISYLLSDGPRSHAWLVLELASFHITDLPFRTSKTATEYRHGLLTTFSRLLNLLQSDKFANAQTQTIAPAASQLSFLCEAMKINSQLLGPFSIKTVPELVVEGSANLISSLARLHLDENHTGLAKRMEEVIEICLVRADGKETLTACDQAIIDLFHRLSMKQRKALTLSWLEQSRQHPLFSCRGRIRALGSAYQTLEDVSLHGKIGVGGQDVCAKVRAQLTDFVGPDWPIETQVAAMQALANLVPYARVEQYLPAVCAGLDNYKNDQRGDVGSLSRMEGLRVVSLMIAQARQKEDSISHLFTIRPVIQRIFRLATEKLDKVRFEAWRCIEAFLLSSSIHPPHLFSHVVDVCTEQYFSTILEFIEIDWLRPHILQGYVHSLASGSEDLMRVSRRALVCLASDKPEDKKWFSVIESFISLLERSYTDDRQAIPLFEAISFVMEYQVAPNTNGKEVENAKLRQRLWNIVRKAHYKTGSTRKLEAAVAIYGMLASHSTYYDKDNNDDIQTTAISKLCNMLLHPFPSIRHSAAAALWMEATSLSSKVLAQQDWSSPVKNLKGAVEEIRKDMLVVKEGSYVTRDA